MRNPNPKPNTNKISRAKRLIVKRNLQSSAKKMRAVGAGEGRQIAALLLFGLSMNANALVNMHEGGYVTTWNDSSATQKIPGLGLDRTYRSRSVRSGLFGFGWCSELETRLTAESQDGKRWGLKACGTEIPSESLERTKEGLYRRQKKDGSLQLFDTKGRLVSVVAKDGRKSRINYDSQGRIDEIKPEAASEEEAREKSYRFRYHPDTGRLQEIAGPEGERLRYEFSPAGDLVRASGPQGDTLYHYDSLHNLIRAELPGGKTETIAYDSDRDQVTSVTTSDGCVETYRISLGADRNHYTSEGQRSCDGRITAQTRLEFFHQMLPDDSPNQTRRLLARVVATRDGRTSSTELSPEHRADGPSKPSRRPAKDEGETR